MQKHISTETRVQNLMFREPWKSLDEKERNYAYFMSKAAWAGAKMVLHQISYESPAIFLLFQAYFQQRDFLMLEEAALKEGVTAKEYRQFMAYAGGFYGNMSNYHSFGALKFTPENSPESFYKILTSNPLFNEPGNIYREVIEELWPQVEIELFNIDKPYTQLNFPYDGGVTGYFGRNMTEDDLKGVEAILRHEKINILNTRAFKREGDHIYNNRIIITVGSISKAATKKEQKFENWTYDLVYGEFSPYLEEMNYYLGHALKYCANET